MSAQLIIDDIKLSVNKLKKNCLGFGAVYATKIVTDYLGLKLSLDEITNCFGDNAKWTAPEQFKRLESLGLKAILHESIDKAFELLTNEQPLIYFDCSDKSCGVIIGYNEKQFYIFNLKKEKTVNHDWFNRVDSFVEIKKL